MEQLLWPMNFHGIKVVTVNTIPTEMAKRGPSWSTTLFVCCLSIYLFIYLFVICLFIIYLFAFSVATVPLPSLIPISIPTPTAPIRNRSCNLYSCKWLGPIFAEQCHLSLNKIHVFLCSFWEVWCSLPNIKLLYRATVYSL